MSEATIGAGRLLLVDDQTEVLWGLGRYLGRAGYTTTVCTDGAEARLCLESADYDLLITDIQMPRMSGLALLDWARKNRPELTIVVITAFGSPSVREICLRKGANVYLDKPVDPKQLLAYLASPVRTATGGAVVDVVPDNPVWDRPLGLIERLQLLLVSGCRAMIRVGSAGVTPGLIHIDQGRIVQAQQGQCTGTLVLKGCLDLQQPDITPLPWCDPQSRTLSIDLGSLNYLVRGESHTAPGCGVLRRHQPEPRSQESGQTTGPTDTPSHEGSR